MPTKKMTDPEINQDKMSREERRWTNDPLVKTEIVISHQGGHEKTVEENSENEVGNEEVNAEENEARNEDTLTEGKRADAGEAEDGVGDGAEVDSVHLAALIDLAKGNTRGIVAQTGPVV